MCTGKPDCPCLQHVIDRDFNTVPKPPTMRETIRRQTNVAVIERTKKRAARRSLIEERAAARKEARAKARGE